MYIPPGFTVIPCEPIAEEAFRSWAVATGGIWHPEGSKPHRRAHSAWKFSSGCGIAAHLGIPTEKEGVEWAPRMPTPPQSVIDVEVEEGAGSDVEQWTPLMQKLFKQWDGYAYDLGCHDWVSELLRGILPEDRIIRYEPPPPGPPPPWVWIDGIYKKNEAA